jgi:RNA polymerase sigma-70 factor (ECF subfamily)
LKLSHFPHEQTSLNGPSLATKTDGQSHSHQPLPAECVEGGRFVWAAKEITGSSEQTQMKKDRILANRIQQGERTATQELYRLYAPTLLRRIRRLLGGDMVGTEDCLQQVFLKVMQSIASYRGDSTLHAWLNRITTHVVMDVFRAQRSKSEVLMSLGSLHFSWWGSDGNDALPEKLFLQDELRELLHQSLKMLGKEKRMAVLLCDWEGYSIEEAANELGIPIGTIASRLHRGRRELRNWL